MKSLATAAMIALSFSAAGFAQAADTTPVTRAQVIAELQQAQAQGLVTIGEEAYPADALPTSTKSRTEVLNELAAAQVAGRVSVGEAAQYPVVRIDQGAEKSRAEVLQELHAYAASGNHHIPA
ncbi:DUF4148 domain-containing protein [Allopusillimonas soli]|uniref:DUF4148 domain-containing protein n=1 Tax=Allopusillimonas soli TaxID=659016 RepID=A0A853FAA1_9BURK|nr:DUF4148 domain-containing protein [Allopusillimonas soli]NYT37033.1 DUF4148 domain-containing protein [Allopusillimonas soli]